MSKKQCEYCLYYAYDEADDSYYCSMNLDQDDLARLYQHPHATCTCFKMGDDYTIVRKQL